MSVPGIPAIQYRVQASNNTLEFWWGPPKTGNYSSITSYTLLCSTINNSLAPSTIIYDYEPSSFYAKLTDLTNRSDYGFQLAANNADGNGPYAVFALAQPGLRSGGPSSIVVSSINQNLSTTVVLWDFSEGPDEAANKYFVLSVIPSTSSATISSFRVPLYPNQRTTDVRIFPSTNYYTFIIQSLNDVGYSYPSMSSLYEIYLGPDRTFYPTRISSLSLWLDITSLSTITLIPGTSTVGAWSDKSPTGNNYVYAGISQASAPDLVYDTEFSTNALSFGRNPTGLVPSNTNVRQFSTNTNFTIFTVHQIDFGPLYNFSPSTNNISLNYNNSFSTLRASYSSNTISSINNNGDVLKGIGCYIVNTNNLVSSNITMSYFNNGYLMSGNNPITNLNPINISSSHIRIGYEHINIQGNPDGYYRGKLFEYLVYNSGFDINDRQIMEGYLAWKYKIPSKLPPNHPYRNNNLSTLAAVPSVQPSTIGYLTVSNVSTTAFTLSWTGGDNANTFIYYLNGVATIPTVDNAITSKSVTFTGLTSGATYTISIAAATGIGATFSKFNPINVGNGGNLSLKHWYDSADPLATGIAPSTGTRITTWFDKSGNPSNAIVNPGGTANVVNDYYNSAIAIQNTFYTVPAMSWMVNNSFTIFVVGYSRYLQPINNEAFFGGSSANQVILTTSLSGDPNSFVPIVFKVGTVEVVNPTILQQVQGETLLMTIVVNGSTGTMFIDGAQVQSVGGINTSTLNPISFFCKGFLASNAFTGGIREMLFYSGALANNSTQMQLVEGYLIWKYNMQSADTATVYNAQNLFLLTGGSSTNPSNTGTAPNLTLKLISAPVPTAYRRHLNRQCFSLLAPTQSFEYQFANYANSSFTISYWLSAESAIGTMTFGITTNGTVGADGFFKVNQQSDRMVFEAHKVGASNSLSFEWTAANGGGGTLSWRFFTITFDATTRIIQFYGNGQFLKSGPIGYSGALQNAQVIGFRGDNNINFYNLAVNNRVLTPNEILTLSRKTRIVGTHPYVTRPPPVNTGVIVLSSAPQSTSSYPGGFILTWSNQVFLRITYTIDGSIVTPVLDNGSSSATAYFGGLASGTRAVNVNFISDLSSTASQISNIIVRTNYNPNNTFYLFSNTTDVGSNPVIATTATNITYNIISSRPATYFSGATSQLLYPFNYSADSFTISFWLFSLTGNNTQIFGLTQTASINGDKFFAVDRRSNSNNIQWFFTGGNLSFEWTRGGEQWNFYTMTYNNTNNEVQFYGNGLRLYTGTGAGSIQFATNINIGNSTNIFYMRQLSVYNRVLLPLEINTLYTTDFI